VQENVDVVRVKVVHEVLTTNLLTPVMTKTTLKTILQPERVVVVAVSTSLAATVVAIKVSITSTSDRAHGDTIGVELSVDLVGSSRALELALVLDGIGNNVDLNLVVREAVVAIEPLEPLLVLSVVGTGDLGSLDLGDGGARVPTDTDVKVTLVSHDLVETSVDVGIESTVVGLLIVLPDLLEGSLQVRGRVPARLALNGTVARHVGKAALALGLGEKSPPDGTVEIRLGGSRHGKAAEDSGDSRDAHIYGCLNE
jgi:hypothetical protein